MEMTCPHCEYETKWKQRGGISILDGEHGEFYTLPIKLVRPDEGSYIHSEEKVGLYACPKCSKAFVQSCW